jgi:hypothetical protein
MLQAWISRRVRREADCGELGRAAQIVADARHATGAPGGEPVRLVEDAEGA